MKVNCVIVTYNRLALLKECLAAIEKQTYPIHKVIVIDNCSTDGTKEYLKAYAVRPQFQVIRTEQNIGGAGGFSLGVKTSVLGGGDYTWMMDDDTIPSPKALEALMQTATQSNDIGFVCSKVLWTDNTLHPRNIPGGLKKDTIETTVSRPTAAKSVLSYLFWSAVVRSTRLACPSKSSLSGSMISNTPSESQEPDSKITIQNKALSYTRLRTCTTRISNRHRSIWPNVFTIKHATPATLSTENNRTNSCSDCRYGISSVS